VPQEQEQKRIQKRSGGGGGGDTEDAGQVQQTTKGEELKAEMDDILDEIDSVLEENAEEFVKSYVQKGGE
jgi:prokaryotic ubiquitin-like protein Pup